jgi:hypothetical protein
MSPTTSEFQTVIDTIEALPIETQEMLITLIQNRLREKRRTLLLETVQASESDYAAGNIKRGSVADLMAEMDD